MEQLHDRYVESLYAYTNFTFSTYNYIFEWFLDYFGIGIGNDYFRMNEGKLQYQYKRNVNEGFIFRKYSYV